MTRARFSELTEARALLEPALALRAFPNADKALISRLKELDGRLDAHIASGDAAAYVTGNADFHAALYARADAPALMALVESIWLQTGPFMRRVYGRLGTTRLTDYHAAAIQALEDRDQAALADAIRADASQAMILAENAFDAA